MEIEGKELPKSLEHCYIENSIVAFNYQTPYFWKYVQQKIVESMTANGFVLDDPVAYKKMSKAVNPYGDGKACSRIVRAFNGEAVVRYGA